MSERSNPYAAPAALGPAPGTSTDAERQRNAYLKHEASVQSVGCLYALGGFVLVPMSLLMLAGLVMTSAESEPAETGIVFGLAAVYLVIGAVQLVTARGLQKLQAWVRVPVGIISGLGLLGFPLGTLINGYILWLVFGEKGRVVLSAHHADVRRQTPHIRYRTSPWAVLILVVVVLLLVAGVAALVANS